MKQRYFWALAYVLSTQIATAELLYVYSDNGDILRSFDSATPGTLSAPLALTGFPGTDSFLFGIDFRPSDGLLYGRSSDGGLNGSTVRINTTTGALTAIGVPTPNGGGSFYGFDFNPVVDRIRLVSDAGNNRRFNPGDGSVTIDTNLFYGAGGATPITHVAYANNVAGATLTTLFGIDHIMNTLVRIGGVNGSPSPNTGELTTIGSLGLDISNFGGFDISGASGIAYLTASVGGVMGLYTINLSTGAATLVGAVGAGNQFFNGLSVQPQAGGEVPEPATFAMLGLGVAVAVLRMRLQRGR